MVLWDLNFFSSPTLSTNRIHMATPLPALGRRYAYHRGQWNQALHPVQRSACEAVQEALDEEILILEKTECVCGARSATEVASRDWYGFSYPLCLCTQCGLLRAGERMTPSSMGRFYGSWYRTVYQSPLAGGVEEEWAERAAQAAQRFSQITSLISLEKGATVVDIGCNFGSLLVACPRSQYQGL